MWLLGKFLKLDRIMATKEFHILSAIASYRSLIFRSDRSRYICDRIEYYSTPRRMDSAVRAIAHLAVRNQYRLVPVPVLSRSAGSDKLGGLLVRHWSRRTVPHLMGTCSRSWDDGCASEERGGSVGVGGMTARSSVAIYHASLDAIVAISTIKPSDRRK